MRPEKLLRLGRMLDYKNDCFDACADDCGHEFGEDVGCRECKHGGGEMDPRFPFHEPTQELVELVESLYQSFIEYRFVLNRINAEAELAGAESVEALVRLIHDKRRDPDAKLIELADALLKRVAYTYHCEFLKEWVALAQHLTALRGRGKDVAK